MAHAAALGAPFFTIGLGADIDRAYLETLAKDTGGRFLETPSPQGLDELFRAIGDFLRSQYVVTLSPGDLERTEPLTLELKVTLGAASGLAREALPALEAAPVTVGPPLVSTQGLVSGAEIDSAVNLSVQVSAELPLKTVRVTVDGALLAEFTAPPFEVGLDPAAYATGSHVVRVEAIDTAEGVGATELSFVAATPPSGGPSVGLLAAGAILLLLATAGAVGLLAIVRRPSGEAALATRVRPWSPRRFAESGLWEAPATEMPTMSDEPLGRLVVAAGPQQGEALEVGVRPRRIGSASYCDLVLADANGAIAPEEARVWVSEGRLLFHKLARLTTFATDNPTAAWLVLQDGDEIGVGSHRLVFELLTPQDSLVEALAQSERREAEQAADQPETPAILRTASQIAEKEGQTPEPALGEETEPGADSD